MYISEEEFKEYHDLIKRQRDSYRNLLEDICSGVPKIAGMASEYRPLTLVEIKDRARKLVESSIF